MAGYALRLVLQLVLCDVAIHDDERNLPRSTPLPQISTTFGVTRSLDRRGRIVARRRDMDVEALGTGRGAQAKVDAIE